jgi:rhodanese-related sulfurtransferase
VTVESPRSCDASRTAPRGAVLCFTLCGFAVGWRHDRARASYSHMERHVQPPSGRPFNRATATEIKRRLDAGEPLRIVDVREVHEHQTARIAQAELRPMSQIQQWWQDLPRDEELVIMCHHGSRSAQVCMALRRAGFERLTNMEGGIDAWSREVDGTVPRY